MLVKGQWPAQKAVLDEGAEPESRVLTKVLPKEAPEFIFQGRGVLHE